MERKEFLDGKKLYYKIEIPEQELTVYLPSKKLQEIGVRLAMTRARLPRVLDRLRNKPGLLPDDYKERQEMVWEKLKTGRVSQMAEVVRDLTWHKHRDHLTKKDSELLAQGTQRLAAEMALATGAEVSEMEKAIVDTLTAATSSKLEQERRHQRAVEVTGLHRVWKGES
jgi:CarD family transcriptional regulator